MSEISKINIPDQTSQTGTATYDIKDSNARTRIVDSGTKNKLMIYESSSYLNKTVNGVKFTFNPDDQTIIVTGQITDNTQNATCVVGTCDTVLGDLLYEGFETANSLAYIETTTGNTKLNVNPVEPISSSDIGTDKQFRIVIDKGYVGAIHLTFKPMVCSSEDFEISDEYVPYAKSNYELTKNCGERVFGKTFWTGQIGGKYAEIFNNYSLNRAPGDYSHAEGFITTASGDYSHAEGEETAASGDSSHAEGSNTTASGNQSHAEGCGTKAASQNQHVQGKFNVVDSSSTYAFIIGNGTSTSARHNAFAIDWNGLIYVNGATTGVDVAALAATIGDINTVLESVL